MGTSLTEEQVAELARLAPVVQLALDSDSAGQEAMLRAAKVAAGRRLELRVVPLPKGEDPAELVQREGGEEIERRIAESVPYDSFRIQRVLDSGDLATAQGKDAVLAALRPIFATMPPSATRDEELRIVASRMDLTTDLLNSLLSQPPPPEREQQAGAIAQRAPAAPLGRREKQERTFLELCIALPALGGPALAELDLEADLATPALRRAAAHLREHLAAPTEALDGDDELTALVRALAVRAAGMERASPAQFRVERLQLELHRIDREIAAARSRDEPMHELARRRSATQAAIGHAMERVMEEGAGRG
jgi:DNA primase